MDTSLLIQYIIIAVLVVGACYYMINKFRKSFSKKKFDKNNSCGNDNCGCS